MIEKRVNTLLNKSFFFISTYHLKTFKRWYKEKRWLSDEDFIKQKFQEKTGHVLDLDSPTTFSEKLQWLKLHERTPLHTLCADKLAVRDYIKEQIGERYLVPLLLHTDSADELRRGYMPEPPYIIKTNHDSSGGVIVEDESKVDWSSIRKHFKRLLSYNYYYHAREWPYKHIKPRILVEKLLLDKKGEIPCDYKLHCFNGKAHYIQIIKRESDQVRVSFYNLKWELMDCRHKKKQNHPVRKPKRLAEMIDIAEMLASPFDYVRVDLYDLHDKVYFGELTFYPASGWGKGFSYSECDYLFGRHLNLSKL